MSSNKERVIQAVENSGEIGVAGLSERLRLDKGTARKVALEAAREGRIGARNDGQGYTFFRADGARHSALLDGHRCSGEQGRSSAPVQVIDADFKEIPLASAGPSADRQRESAYAGRDGREVAPSNSRALTPSPGSGRALQPYDSRTEAALRQHAVIKSRANRLVQSPLIPKGFDGLNALFVQDPHGDETLAALAGAIAAQEWERQRLADERAAEDAQRREKAEREKSDRHEAIMAILNWSGAATEDRSPPARVYNFSKRRARDAFH